MFVCMTSLTFQKEASSNKFIALIALFFIREKSLPFWNKKKWNTIDKPNHHCLQRDITFHMLWKMTDECCKCNSILRQMQLYKSSQSSLICRMIDHGEFCNKIQELSALFHFLSQQGKKTETAKEGCIWLAKWCIAIHNHLGPYQD